MGVFIFLFQSSVQLCLSSVGPAHLSQLPRAHRHVEVLGSGAGRNTPSSPPPGGTVGWNQRWESGGRRRDEATDGEARASKDLRPCARATGGGGSQETEANSLLNSRSRLWFPATRSLYFWMLQRAEHELHPAPPHPLSNSPLLPPCPPVMSPRISLTRATNTQWDARSAPDRAEDTAAGWSGRGREGWWGRGRAALIL